VNGLDSSRLRPSETRSNYFVRHWRGSMSLAVSYWINGAFLATIAPAAAMKVVDIYVDGQESLRLAACFYLLAMSVVLARWFWAVVGIWRSSDRHTSRGGRAIYANLAKLMVVLSAFSMMGQIVKTHIPVGKEMVVLALGEDPIGTFEATVSANGRSLLFAGMLREGAAREVRQMLDAAPSVNTLVLSSSGGRLREAKLLAAMVRKRGLRTYVEDHCESACTFVFVSGTERAVTSTARIGFHSPSAPGSSRHLAKTAVEYMAEIYLEAGLPGTFIEKVSGIDHW